MIKKDGGLSSAPYLIEIIVGHIQVFGCLMMCVAYLTLLERKVLGHIQVFQEIQSRQKSSKPRLHIVYLLLKDNIAEVPVLVRLAHELKIREVILIHMALVSNPWQEEQRVRERTRELAMVQEATIESMSSLTETRDPDTGGHIKRTQNYIRLLADHLKHQPDSASSWMTRPSTSYGSPPPSTTSGRCTSSRTRGPSITPTRGGCWGFRVC
jgi:hypothetical protein